MRPRRGSRYKLLAVCEPDYQHLVGQTFVVDDFSDALYSDSLWELTGRVEGQLGSFNITAKLGIPDGPTR